MTGLSQIVCPACGAVNRVPMDRPVSAARCGACHRALFNGHSTAVGEAGFKSHLRANDIPLLLDVWAPWCGPCRIMAPQFERAAELLEPRVRLLKLNAHEAPNVAAKLGVRGIPAMYLFQNSSVLAHTAGAMNADAIVRWTREHLAPQSVRPKPTDKETII